MLSQGEWSTTDLFLGRLYLAKQFLILSAKRFNSMLQPFNLKCGVTIVRKNVLFLNLQRPSRLLRSSLFVDKLLVLRLEELVGVWTFAELLVDEAILTSQRLNILGQFCHFLSFQLGKLSLLVDLFFHTLAFLAQSLDLLFALEKFPLVCILFTGCDAHLMLDVSELEALFLMQLLDLDQLLGLLIELTLHLVKVAVKHGDRLL